MVSLPSLLISPMLTGVRGSTGKYSSNAVRASAFYAFMSAFTRLLAYTPKFVQLSEMRNSMMTAKCRILLNEYVLCNKY